MSETALSIGDDLLLSFIDGLAIVDLRREKSLNALSSSYFDALLEALKTAESKAEVRVLLLQSSSSKAFVAGADIAELARGGGANLQGYVAKAHRLMTALEASRLVTVAAVNGFCLGGGFELALSCDLLIAGPKAIFAFPEIGLGVAPGFGGTQRFPRAVGLQAALKYMLTGDRFGVDEAAHLGLIWRRVDEAVDFNAATRDLLKSLAQQAPQAMAAIKKLARYAMDYDLASGLNSEQEVFLNLVTTTDAREGLAAFLEKRKPNFKG